MTRGKQILTYSTLGITGHHFLFRAPRGKPASAPSPTAVSPYSDSASHLQEKGGEQQKGPSSLLKQFSADPRLAELYGPILHSGEGLVYNWSKNKETPPGSSGVRDQRKKGGDYTYQNGFLGARDPSQIYLKNRMK